MYLKGGMGGDDLAAGDIQVAIGRTQRDNHARDDQVRMGKSRRELNGGGAGKCIPSRGLIIVKQKRPGGGKGVPKDKSF